jgi:thiol-disulfide isomerase/thioredoxin
MPDKKSHKSTPMPHILIIAGVAILAFVILGLKDRVNPAPSANTGILPEVQLEQALQAGKPALAFFHSNNCEQCIIMIQTVDQVHPEFASAITLIDVDVYDPRNNPLLTKVGLQFIPTLVFFDSTGDSETFIGVMNVDRLRNRLAALAGEP